jgi:hypothetical protein
MERPTPRLRAYLMCLLGAAGLAGCGDQDKIITVEGVPYYFPAGVVQGFLPAEHNGRGKHFIRLKPAQGYLSLVYDPLTTHKPNEQGPDVPTISGINFAPGQEVEVFRTQDGPVVCIKTLSDLRYTCGMRLPDAGLTWIVKFDRDLLASAGAIKARAEKTLLRYRTDGRLKPSR